MNHGILCEIHSENLSMQQRVLFEKELHAMPDGFDELYVALLCNKYGIMHEYRII